MFFKGNNNSVVSVTALQILRENCMTLTMTFRMFKWSNVNMPIERSHETYYLSAIAMLAQAFNVCEIIESNL